MKNWKKRTTSYCPSWTGKWKFYNKTDGDYAQRCEEELFDLQRNKQELERTLLLKDKEIYNLQTDLKEARDVLKAN